MRDIKELVKGTTVKFSHYHDGNLWYNVVGHSFEFPVPIEDIGNATFCDEEKGLMMMRYIRKHLELIQG